MERNRESRRASMAAANGLSKRRHRSSGLRDSPEEDGAMELQESSKLRYRGVKKDRDRDRDRDRLSRSKRRRGDRLMHGSSREDGGEDSTEESVNDEEEEEDDDDGGGSEPVRMLPPNPAASISNHHYQQGKSFPSAAKIFRAVPAWKPADEMIGVSVPRKARSASTKRSHECWVPGSGVGGDQIHRQASSSPVRPSLASTSTPLPAPISPPSSNASSARKKMKTNGAKPRPPKSSLKSSSSSNPEELEIEIAEVLYGLMTQSQGPSKKEIMSNDSGKLLETNKSNSDSKSRVSSPISNSQSTAPQSSVILQQNSISSAPTLSAVAPKRKRPRQVTDNSGSFCARNSPISAATMVEMDQLPKAEISSPNFEKTSSSAAENMGIPYDLTNPMASQPSSESPTELFKPESSAISESKPSVGKAGEIQDVTATEEEFASPKEESPSIRVDDDCEDVTVKKANSAIHEIEDQRKEKFQIDLMAPPPQLRSSPEGEGKMSFVETAADHKHLVSNGDAEIRPKAKDKEDAKAGKIFKDCAGIIEPEGKNVKSMVEEPQSQKLVVDKDRNIDLQFDLEKLDRHVDAVGASDSKAQPQFPKLLQQQQLKAKKDERQEEKADNTISQSSSLPLPISLAGWPGGLPPMGYISMDGSTVSSTPIQPLFTQPRPKKCATHCYIARNIHNLQQIVKMNAFWPAPASSATLFGAKPSDLNAMAPVELHKNIAGRRVNSAQDKGQGLAVFPTHTGKDKGSQAANIGDTMQRKQQILLQQALPPVPPSNVLHGPAFIFPMSQQQTVAAAAASARPGPAKSPTVSLPSSNAASSASASSSAPAGATASAMSFNYPNIAANEAQYLAILQNNGYPFPIPTVAAPPNYRPTHAQTMPYFNGSFYSSQLMHPSQFLHQQQPHGQQQQMQQGHQNTSNLSGSSTSQKHLPSQHQKQGSSTNGESGSGNSSSFPAPKNRSSHPSQQQPPVNQHILQPPHTRQLEADVGGEDSPSTTDSRVSRASMNVYGQNFAMPIQNFALMTPPVLGGTSIASCGDQQIEKKQQQQSQQQGLKAGVESLSSQTFALSFAPINGATAAHGIDISSMTQNQAIFQSLPEATRQSYHILAAAQAAQQHKNFRASEEVKTGGSDLSNVDEERKGLAGKVSGTVGHSIAFSRPDLTETSGSFISGSTVIDSSARTLNLASAPTRTSRSALPNAMSAINASNSHLQAQLQQQQQQIIQLQKQQQQQQQQLATNATRSKTPATSNVSVYSDQLPSSSSLAVKFSNAVSPFPQNIVQSSSNSSPVQSSQWKNSTRTTTSQAPSLLASSTPSLKNIPQHQTRSQQSHTQISFGASPKSSASSQGQQMPNSSQSASPPLLVGSPTASSFSKGGASGSPRTASSSGNKASQSPTLPSQQTKNSPSVPSRKSSPVGGRNVPSILGSSHITSSASSLSTVSKPQMQQQHLPKQTLQQQQQLCFSGSYMQAHSASASSTVPASNSYHIQRRRLDQPQQPQGSLATSTGMLSLCPPVSTCDPAKAIAAAAAAGNAKGGSLPAPGMLPTVQFAAQSSGNPHQLIPAGFSYVHTVSSAVQAKPAEQKQPAGNDNLHACWQPEKK